MQQTIPQALLAHVNLPFGSFSTGEPCTFQEEFRSWKILNQVVAIQQMWTLCHPSDQMEVARNFDIHLIHATLFLFLVDGIYGTAVVLSRPFCKDTFETTYYHQTVCKFAFEICFGESIKYYDIDHSTLPLKLFATRLGYCETHSSFMILRQSTSL